MRTENNSDFKIIVKIVLFELIKIVFELYNKVVLGNNPSQ